MHNADAVDESSALNFSLPAKYHRRHALESILLCLGFVAALIGVELVWKSEMVQIIVNCTIALSIVSAVLDCTVWPIFSKKHTRILINSQVIKYSRGKLFYREDNFLLKNITIVKRKIGIMDRIFGHGRIVLFSVTREVILPPMSLKDSEILLSRLKDLSGGENIEAQ